ncbi:glucosamine-6-phosphate isomerase, putative [Trypanosoma equiperdum]|uniref:Glucosamine-6-phosphate isomerase n=4 Tax=Trypanozoon TaxID=39700 RepID=Q381A9_TRYB2|nr:glucosamine-6-phosphate isomerase, putative [Trypanosoma brucei gambiense DAL972]XP_829734.1 glucosamine-6-phosphate isomerase, putative [Trypanosoma brucei brucei TREU927]RHW67557.1 glucosamine-6-phosphate isomerase [Trypanosoma brucei equiperdum]SCU67717.1 glucosamine-6-phosphate isomerase, putative [Trypanosoma equiperdum]EAN80622.1 glucosamine-6-phosphate isomerase, putative [Trypanosoma brucei brucei TREU927]CBH18771.1 glucosamine-6-phosphate isomerase, putative [Trypanosoma brucei gam|eukprot:XP_011781035.1 glucosamine-6-phosphate isomerase, putative [Trypanosoma brucei gambiense DAL972]
MRIVISPDDEAVADYVSEYIIKKIIDFGPSSERPFVIGLPTGSSPLKTYQRLVKAYRDGRISFRNVVTFNMDEYVGLPRDHPQSYYYFMKHNFFDHVDIPEQNRNLLNGTAADLVAECRMYEEKIAAVGGVELFLAGVGTDGHLAFNEPGSSLESLTRVKSLNQETITSNARFFDNDIRKVPTMALTVGIRTVMNARNVVVVATGAGKAVPVAHCVEGSVTHAHPITALQLHPAAVLCVDEDATLELKVKTVRYFKGLLEREEEFERLQSSVESEAPPPK